MQLSDIKPSLRVLAFGALLKNRACLIDGDSVLYSEVHGNLVDPKACQLLIDSINRLRSSATGPLDLLVHDMHPDFFSTALATRFSRISGVPSVSVQHHHAHIASVMAEHNLNGAVLGIALDGAGWGPDKTIWGGELLIVNGAEYRRIGHLRQLALPGGDLAATQTWRMAASALHLLGRGDELGGRFSSRVGQEKVETVKKMLDNSVNAPLSSSAGRWFDVAAGLLGVCDIQHFEAEAAQRLEACAQRWLAQHPEATGTSTAQVSADLILDLSKTIEQLTDVPAPLIDQAAASFHLDLIEGIVKWVSIALELNKNINRICLSGGCFYNIVLKDRLIVALQALNLKVFIPGIFGGDFGDAGLALGQAYVGKEFLKKNDGANKTCL